MNAAVTTILVTYAVFIHLVPSYFCWRKGRRGAAIAGFFIPIFGVVGAVRLAKPDSSYALSHYDQTKTDRAIARYAPSDWAPPSPSDPNAPPVAVCKGCGKKFGSWAEAEFHADDVHFRARKLLRRL